MDRLVEEAIEIKLLPDNIKNVNGLKSAKRGSPSQVY
jgi:hypothetical protein